MSAALTAAKARLASARSSLPSGAADADVLVWSGDLGLIQDLVLTLEAQERDIQRVIDAWQHEGANPVYHHRMRRMVAEKWRPLAKAIAGLMMTDRDVRRRPPEREIPPA